MFDYSDIGDPYINWNKENSARENPATGENEVPSIEDLKSEVVKLLVSNYDFSIDEAEAEIESSDADLWHENVDVNEMAKLLASDGDDE